MEELIIEVAKLTGMNPVAVASAIPLLVIVCNAVTRAIPDTATGPLKYVRLVTKFVGLHIKDNSGVSAIKDSTGAVIRRTAEAAVPEQINDVLELTPEMEFKGLSFKDSALKLRERSQSDEG